MKKITQLVTISLCSVLSTGFAASPSKNVMATSRYFSIENKPSAAQVNLLSQTIQLRFPQKVQTVGDAVNYLLRFSGYSLIPVAQRSIAFNNVLLKPLPLVDRDFGPMPLHDGLLTLVGPAFYLVSDPLNRTVDFRVKLEMRHRLTQREKY